MGEHVFTGFGFGPIQGGLFAAEAFKSGNFSRIAVAEIDRRLVEAVKANNGSYWVNVAGADGIEPQKIDRVELLDPNVSQDRRLLAEVLDRSTEIVTCLPSVKFYESGGENSVASLIAEGLEESEAEGTIVYTAENNNHAAEILDELVGERIDGPLPARVQFLNTVIGKMSRVVDDPAEIAQLKLKTIAPGIERAFLVEQFNRILVGRTWIPDFTPGIGVFIEKDDLLPFEEAKLYGHNAVHSLLGFIGAVKGCSAITQLKDEPAIMQIARGAFLGECGPALIKKYGSLGDELFTEAGFRDYADDLLERMTSPYLADTVARAGRDAVRKLGINDRIFGTMQLALDNGIEPKNMAIGAVAGIVVLIKQAEQYDLPADLRFGDWRKLSGVELEAILNWVWRGQACRLMAEIVKCVVTARGALQKLVGK
ncbi:MAG TPA: hypothetical protein VJJ98_14340 [Sedimentisphaerales bacterium]|nr:hypothetical protein [Sedimentisphaerales bacterium]